jgi:hypothetical protein
MSSIALGNGVKSSGLMDTVDGLAHHMLEGRALYTVVLVLSAVVLVRPLLFPFPHFIDPLRTDTDPSHPSFPRLQKLSPGPNYTTSRQRPLRQSLEPAYFPNRADLFDWDAYAGVWVPESAYVRLMFRVLRSLLFHSSRYLRVLILDLIDRVAQGDGLRQVYLHERQFPQECNSGEYYCDDGACSLLCKVSIAEGCITGRVWAVGPFVLCDVTTQSRLLMPFSF